MSRVWRQKPYGRRTSSVPSVVVLVLLIVAVGALGWTAFLSTQPDPEPAIPGVILALKLPQPGKQAPTTTAMLGLNVRRAPPPAPEAEPFAADPPPPEPSPGIVPELAAPVSPVPDPEPPVERDMAVVEALEPETAAVAAPTATVVLIEPRPSLPSEVSPNPGAPSSDAEPLPEIELAAQDTSPQLAALLASPSEPFVMAAPEDSWPQVEAESTDILPPSEPARAPAAVVALAHPPSPALELPPGLETVAAESSALEETLAQDSRDISVAMVEPPATGELEPAEAVNRSQFVAPEAVVGIELDEPELGSPEAPGLALHNVPLPAPEPEPAPKFAGVTIPVPEEDPLGRETPMVHLFSATSVPVVISDGAITPEPEQPSYAESPPAPRPVVTLATFIRPASAPPPEIEVPIEFAGFMPVGGSAMSAFVLNAVLAIEPQAEESPQAGADIVPDDMLIEGVDPAKKASRSAGSGAADFWLAYARPFEPPAERPLVAVVVLGLGTSHAATNAAIKLPGAVTLGISSFARRLQDWIDLARAAGHEVMLDVPMEPMKYPDIDPGPQALMTSLPDAENLDRLKWHLDRASGYFGVTNNMGSRFTSSPEDLEPVLSTLKLRGLMYLDSRTSRSRVAAQLASSIGLPHAISDRFLDAEASRPAIDARLEEIERIARRTGFAVAIGHAFPVTIGRLSAWLATLEDKGITLAPVSAIVAQKAP